MKIQPSITKFQELNNTIWQRKITFKIDSMPVICINELLILLVRLYFFYK